MNVVSATRFPVLARAQNGSPNPVMISRSALALSHDDKWLAYLRIGPEGVDGHAERFLEIIETNTGSTRSLKVGSDNGIRSIKAVAFDQGDETVLLARTEMDYPVSLVCRIEKWSRVSGSLEGTVTLPLPPSRIFANLPPSGRLVFSADRQSLLHMTFEPDTPSSVWGLATGKLVREFEPAFTAETFFPDGRRIIGMTGSKVLVRDVKTGGTTNRWMLPDGRTSILANLRFNPGSELRSSFQADAQSLWVSPDGRWLAGLGQTLKEKNSLKNPLANVEMPTTVYLFDAVAGQLRAD